MHLTHMSRAPVKRNSQ